MNYQQYSDAKQELIAVANRQSEFIQGINYDSARKTKELPSQTLAAILDKLHKDTLNVLVMGVFSSGKSAFLDALIGEKLLPVDALPCTAVIGEIEYGNDECCTLFPRDESKQPVIISKGELEKYIVIPHGQEDTSVNPYERVIIQSQLPICRQGVRMIDSPGLNDPTSHDKVTLSYLPQADAIIYCMTCLQAFTEVDKNTIEELRHLGYTCPIFVMTRIDNIEDEDEDDGTHKADELREHLRRTLKPYTDLHEEGVFFVNSKGALKGKKRNDASLIKQSYFDVLEEKLEQILTEQKGKMRLKRIFKDMQGLNSDMIKFSEEQQQILAQDGKKLEESAKKARIPYEKAIAEKKKIERAIANKKEYLKDLVTKKARNFYKELIKSISQDAQKFQSDISFINPFKMKENIEKYVQTLSVFLKLKIEGKVSAWGKGDLAASIEKVTQELNDETINDVRSFLSCISKITETLNVKTENAVKEGEVPLKERLFAAGLGLLIGDLYSVIGGASGGFAVMGRTIACELAGMAVLWVCSFFTPIGLPAFIFTGILSLVIGGTWSGLSLESKIRDKTVEQVVEAMSKKDREQEFVGKILAGIDKIFANLETSVDQNLQSSINEAGKLLEIAEKKLALDGKEVRDRQDHLQTMLNLGEQVKDSLRDIGDRFLIA